MVVQRKTIAPDVPVRPASTGNPPQSLQAAATLARTKARNLPPGKRMSPSTGRWRVLVQPGAK